jgi:3-deoxy-7-phosphoheptulonate synthase
VDDLLVYMAIGARSVEDQQHRLVASGVCIPVGMKNPTSGNLDVMLNSIVAAQSKQYLPFAGWEVETEGNPYAHAILRGYSKESGGNRPNYYYEDLCELHDRYYHMNLVNPSVIIDCNHANSNKKHEEQIRIAEDVFDSCKRNREINRFVKGIMIESYLVEGKQMIGEGIYGCSITDPCLGWESTERLILDLAEFEF